MIKRCLKKLTSYILVFVMCVSLVFVPSVDVRAGLVDSLGIKALFEALMLSSGMLVNGLGEVNETSLNEACYESLKAYMFKENKLIYAAMLKCEELMYDDLESLGDGESISYDEGVTLTKESSGNYKMSVDKVLVDEAAAVVADWAENDATVSVCASDVFSNYWSSVSSYDYSVLFNKSYDSLSRISTAHGSAAYEAITDMGYNDSNCMVVSFTIRPYNSAYYDTLFEGLVVENKEYVVLMPVEFGDSFMLNYCNMYNDSTGFRYDVSFLKTASTDFFKTIHNYHLTKGYNEAVSYMKNEMATYNIPCVVVDGDTATVAKMNTSEEFSDYLVQFDNLFNAATAAANDSFLVRNFTCYTGSTSDAIAVIDVTAEVSGLLQTGRVYKNEAATVDMSFTASTADNLASIADLDELVSYTRTLSKQLLELESTMVNVGTAGADTVVDGLEEQTGVIAGLLERIEAAVKDVTAEPDGDNEEKEYDSGSIPFLNGLLIGIYILFELLKIFLHCLEFIVNIFKIEATPGFLNEDMLVGLDFIKQFQIGDWGISVYDFLMSLVHILIFFAVVKMFKQHIDRMHL